MTSNQLSSAKPRCGWPGDDPVMIRYHDREWGRPSRDDAHLFEMLILDNAQAGLSWRTILHKREGYRQALAGFDAVKIARFTDAKLEKLRDDPGIIRNRLKIKSHRQNARAFLAVQDRCGSFADYLWDFVDGQPVVNRFKTLSDLPAVSPLSDRISKDMKRCGFNFVGSTIVYAFLQSVGVVNDHLVTCFRHRELDGALPK